MEKIRYRFFYKTNQKRVIRYFEILVSSFDVMIDGMSKDEFLKFRIYYLGSFSCVIQFRLIEICSIQIKNLFKGKEEKHNILDNLYCFNMVLTELKTKNKTFIFTI